MSDEVIYGIVAIGILMVVFALRSMGKKRQNHISSRDSARDHIERARQKQGVRDELEALMVDINRMAKDLGAQLDAKLVRIEKATREAEEKIARLEAIRDAETDPYAIKGPSRSKEIAPPEPAAPADPLTAEVYKLADQGKGANDIAQALGEHIGKIELILALRSG